MTMTWYSKYSSSDNMNIYSSSAIKFRKIVYAGERLGTLSYQMGAGNLKGKLPQGIII